MPTIRPSLVDLAQAARTEEADDREVPALRAESERQGPVLSSRDYSVAMQSISTSELPGIPPAAAIVVRTGGSGPKRPRNISFIAA